MNRTLSAKSVYVEAQSPFRTPNWRWKIVESSLQRGLTSYRGQDTAVRELLSYVRLLARDGAASAIRQSPALSAAHAIYDAPGIRRDELEARLIAGEPNSTISRKMNLDVVTIEAFEASFFNVSNALKATDWVMCEVIKLHPRRPVTEAQIWKYLAFAGGSVLVDLMVDDFLNRPCTSSAERGELAAKGRYVVREYATDWSCRSAVQSIVQEGCRLFPQFGRIANGTKEDKLIAVHLHTVRLAAGLETPPEPEPETNKLRTSTPRKDFSYEIPQV